MHTARFAVFIAVATLLDGRPSGAERQEAPAAGVGAPRAERYIAMLERKERDVFQKPDDVMRTLALRPGERVADVGAGSGYFTLRVARAVGPTGRVLAIDINPDLLEFLDRRAKEAGLANVVSRRVEKDDPDLPPAGIDTILMVDTFHYIKERAAYARKLRAGLAPGGRIVVIDYLLWAGCPGAPRPERRLSRESVDEAMAAAGLAPSKVHEFLPEQFFVEYMVRQGPRVDSPAPADDDESLVFERRYEGGWDVVKGIHRRDPPGSRLSAGRWKVGASTARQPACPLHCAILVHCFLRHANGRCVKNLRPSPPCGFRRLQLSKILATVCYLPRRC